MPLLELPEDILSIIVLLLKPKDFLALCRSSKPLYHQYRQDSAFWRIRTSETFRIPVSPLLKADGERWYWLYKRLKTQTRLYTWGQGLKGGLGRGRGLRAPVRRGLRGVRAPVAPRAVFDRVSSSWPTEGHVPDEVGVIADLQCGGWSTTILSSEGKLYTTGSIDSKDGITIGKSSDGFEYLEYMTQSQSAIKQFSAGRCHILAMTDDAEILSWDRIDAKGLKIYSRHGTSFGGKPVKVCAGWTNSSAYMPEIGIVYWTPVKNDQSNQMLDAVQVKEKIIPGTARTSSEGGSLEVVAYTVLENFIIWVTSDSKLWGCDILHEDDDDIQPRAPPFQIPGYASSSDQIQDVQGSFRNFAVFTSGGRVLAGNTEYVNVCSQAARMNTESRDNGDDVVSDPINWSNIDDIIASRPTDIPALQHSHVIAIAFGDWHYHALHSNGKITSYGKELQSCGSLGLGAEPAGGQFRGLRKAAPSWETNLLPIANVRGRQVWFEPEKKDWLSWLRLTAIRTPLPEIQNGLQDANTQAMLSEWVEQEGRHWEQGPLQSQSRSTRSETEAPEDFSHLGSYFAIAVSAAGWHSGSLVLVDEEKADHVEQLWRIRTDDEPKEHIQSLPGAFDSSRSEPQDKFIWEVEGFPKIQLPNGQELPGTGGTRIWRDGMPTLSSMGLS